MKTQKLTANEVINNIWISGIKPGCKTKKEAKNAWNLLIMNLHNAKQITAKTRNQLLEMQP